MTNPGFDKNCGLWADAYFV